MAFVEVARFPNRLEAETIGHALDALGIPFLVKSEDIGIFGPGHVLNTPGGAGLWVPEEAVEEVQCHLSCLMGKGSGEGQEEEQEEEREAEGPVPRGQRLGREI